MAGLPGGYVLWVRVLVLTLCVAACGVLDPSRGDLSDSAGEFSRMVRWGETEAAAAFFVPSLQEDFFQKITAHKGLKVTSMTLELAPDTQAGKMRTRGDLEYYILPSLTIRTLPVELDWALQGEPGVLPRQWRIVSHFPAF